MNHREELSFLPEDYLQRRTRERTAWLGTAAIILVAGATALLAIRANASLKTTGQSHAQVQQAYDDCVRRFNLLCVRRDGQRKILQHAAVASAMIERVPRSNILAELTNRLPAGASLVDLTLESRARPEPVSVATTAFDMKKAAVEARRKAEAMMIPEMSSLEVGVKISGLADTDVEVAHYLSELHQSPLFHDVNLLISESYSVPGKSGKTLRRFQIQMTVNADARLTPRSESSTAATVDVND